MAVFSELPPSRKREISSAVGHYVAGVLDREPMETIIARLWQSAVFAKGDRVRTLRGSLRGEIVAVLDDGRVKWRAETGSVLIALSESLLPDE